MTRMPFYVLIINVPQKIIINVPQNMNNDDEYALYNDYKCPTKKQKTNYDDEDALYNDYKCPTKDELPIILRVTLPPCAVFHLISEYITFLWTKIILILLLIIMMTDIIFT